MARVRHADQRLGTRSYPEKTRRRPIPAVKRNVSGLMSSGAAAAEAAATATATAAYLIRDTRRERLGEESPDTSVCPAFVSRSFSPLVLKSCRRAGRERECESGSVESLAAAAAFLSHSLPSLPSTSSASSRVDSFSLLSSMHALFTSCIPAQNISRGALNSLFSHSLSHTLALPSLASPLAQRIVCRDRSDSHALARLRPFCRSSVLSATDGGRRCPAAAHLSPTRSSRTDEPNFPP